MSHHGPPRQAPTPLLYHAAVVEGLEAVARDELRHRLGRQAQVVEAEPAAAESGAVRFTFTGPTARLAELRTVIAVYRVRHFAVPRPRALLGDQHLRQLLADVGAVLATDPAADFRTLYLSAAGRETAVMERLAHAIAAHTGLAVSESEGDLQLRLRRPPDGNGWEVLIRLTPRPLATRPWRVCNMPGALNATVAHAIAVLTRPRPSDRYLNLACGSGSLLIERQSLGPARQLVGCDHSREALACARQNLRAASADAILLAADATALPFADASFDVLTADLPFGGRIGSHAGNLRLYPPLLHEAARVARSGAALALLTHEVRLTEQLIADSPSWLVEQQLRINLRGLHPRIYLLRRQ